MTALATLATAGAAFAVAGWHGPRVAHTLCAGYAADPSGPQPVRFARWPFALAAALAGLAIAARGESLAHVGLALVAVFALAACTAADLECGILPDALTLGTLALILGAAALGHNVAPFTGAVLVAVPFAVLALLSSGVGMGWGDVKLAALGGALLGAPEAVASYILAAFAAYIVARHMGRARRPIAFGPYLAIAIATTFALRGAS